MREKCNTLETNNENSRVNEKTNETGKQVTEYG